MSALSRDDLSSLAEKQGLKIKKDHSDNMDDE